MAHPYYPSGDPRFNHVAMSLPADLLDERHRAEICRFWSEVFGFDEIEVMTEDRRRLILSCVHWDQFIFLVADDRPMEAPRMDHFGFSVGTWTSSRGSVTGPWPSGSTTTGSTSSTCPGTTRAMVEIHSLYVRYLLPMMCEFQWWEFAQ